LERVRLAKTLENKERQTSALDALHKLFRFTSLTKLGLDWEKSTGRRDSAKAKAYWHERFNDLKAYKLLNNHCNVKRKDSNKQLALWVKNQRTQYRLKQEGKPSSMSDDRMHALNDIGFEWTLSPTTG
jgi:hypothetical protein